MSDQLLSSAVLWSLEKKPVAAGGRKPGAWKRAREVWEAVFGRINSCLLLVVLLFVGGV